MVRVRHILSAAGGEVLLAEARVPAEAPKDGPDQIVLGLALVGGARGGEAGEHRSVGDFEVVERLVVERCPIGGTDDGFGKEIADEEAAVEHFPEAHA